jgi:hypothetical protein
MVTPRILPVAAMWKYGVAGKIPDQHTCRYGSCAEKHYGYIAIMIEKPQDLEVLEHYLQGV